MQPFSKSEKYKLIKEKKQSISVEELTKNCPKEFCMFMNYCRNLSFKHVPDYAYLKNLFKKMAAKEDIDLNDKLFDWSIKAITIQAYPHFYDFFQYQYFNPLNKKGKFTHINSNDRKSKKTEEEIYKLSAYFKFRSNPK